MNKYYMLGDIFSYTDLNFLRNLFNNKLVNANAKKHRKGTVLKRRNHQDETNSGLWKKKRNYIIEISKAAAVVRTMKGLIDFTITEQDKYEALKVLSVIEFGMFEKYSNRVKSYKSKVVTDEI